MAELVHPVLAVHRDPLGPRVTQALPDLRVMLANVDLPDQKAPVVFRVLLGLLVVALVELPFPARRDLEVLLALPDPRAIKASKVLLDPLVLPEQTVNLDLRVRMARPVLLDLLVLRVLPDLLESVALPVRMR